MTDTRTLLGPLGVWGLVSDIAAPDLRPAVAHVAQLGYGALWVGEGAGRDPFAQLAAEAARPCLREAAHAHA